MPSGYARAVTGDRHAYLYSALYNECAAGTCQESVEVLTKSVTFLDFRLSLVYPLDVDIHSKKLTIRLARSPTINVVALGATARAV